MEAVKAVGAIFAGRDAMSPTDPMSGSKADTRDDAGCRSTAREACLGMAADAMVDMATDRGATDGSGTPMRRTGAASTDGT